MLWQLTVAAGMIGMALLARHIWLNRRTNTHGDVNTMLSPRATDEFHSQYGDKMPY